MHTGHGQAQRLSVEGADLGRTQAAIDEAVARGREDGGGEDARASVREDVRMLLGNRFLGPGRFGKMFPDLAPFRPPDDALRELGRAMRETAPEDPSLNNSDLPAGFTYLGQFVDHDITRDETRGFPPIDDPELISQGRRLTLDLDSVYGQGPTRQPELYDPNFRPGKARFRLGPTTPVTTGNPAFDAPSSLPNDLPRRRDKAAIIPDDRNDENTVVAQTHLAFLKFHNRVMDAPPPGARGEEDEDDDGASATFTQAEETRRHTPFHRARRLVRWHYQWLVFNHFVRRLIDPEVFDDMKANGRRFYRFETGSSGGEPFMPLEFSVAAYRLGHSMVREGYNFNRVFADPAVSPGASFPATLDLLFSFTGGGGFLGAATLPTNWVIDWRRFFGVGRRELLNFTRKIDTKLAPQLHQLPGSTPGQPASLAVRNLLRGSRLGLPTGQDVAEAMGLKALRPGEVAGGEDGPVLRRHGFHEWTPLWYYVLKEAEVRGGGGRLGGVGSRIVGEVFLGLLEGDPNSYLSRRPGWTPQDDGLPSAKPGDFTMVDLLRFVNDINPLG